MRHLSAMYCPLFPPPRSTIAAAFSPDGKALASTQYVTVLLAYFIDTDSRYKGLVDLCEIVFVPKMI